MKNKKSIIALFFLIAITLGCTKYPDLYDPEHEKDIAITYYDTTTNFNQYLTYSIVDTVGEISWDNSADSLTWQPSVKSQLILTEINNHLASLGYTKVDTSANPDLFVNASILKIEQEYVDYYYPYYGWGGGYFWDWGYPGFSYYYPYFIPYYYTQTYGSIVMELADAKNINASTHTIKMLWTGMVVGSIDVGSDIDSRIKSGINDCFNQSPYLAK